MASIIERTIFIFRHNLSTKNIHNDILEYLNKKDIEGAKKYCENMEKKVLGAHIILAGLNMANNGEHRIEKAIEAEAGNKINMLERGFSILIALGSLAPITGFLGTVSGMITAFQSIAKASEVSAQLVANGIFEALITTVYGLVIAIFAISGYNIFAYIVDRFVADIEKASSDIVTSLVSLK